jgi:hypothetical protein
MLLLLGRAWAQEEACGGVLREEELHEALDATEAALAELSVDRADRILDDVVDNLRCVGTALAPDDLGRLARHLALVAFYDADGAELRSWTWLERDTVGGSWPEAELPVPATFHGMRSELSEPPMVAASGGWAVPKGGVVWVDGRPSVAPEARSEVPHLMQVLDKKGRVLWSGWMLGAAAPERWLDPSGRPGEVPGWVVVPPPPAPWDDGVVEAPEAVEAEDDEALVGAEPEGERDDGRSRPARTTEFMEVFPECPWRQGPNKVTVEGTTVNVNRFGYPTRKQGEVEALGAVFRQCGEFRAARRLARWAETRGKLFGGGEAAQHRDAMVRMLLADEPTRKR